MLCLTRRELETWPPWNRNPTTQSKERAWKPSTYRARASSRPYLVIEREKLHAVDISIRPCALRLSLGAHITHRHYYAGQRYRYLTFYFN